MASQRTHGFPEKNCAFARSQSRSTEAIDLVPKWSFWRPDGIVPSRPDAFILICRSHQVDGGLTMRCRSCAYDNDAATRFCVACGTSLAPVCARCGRDFPEAARFCAWCGEPRTPDARIADVPGERKQATVLFADIAGSTARI